MVIDEMMIVAINGMEKEDDKFMSSALTRVVVYRRRDGRSKRKDTGRTVWLTYLQGTKSQVILHDNSLHLYLNPWTVYYYKGMHICDGW